MTNILFRSSLGPNFGRYRRSVGPRVVLGLCVGRLCDLFEDEVGYPSDEW